MFQPPPPPTVTFSPAASFSRAPVSVTLTASDPAAVIRCTLDGTEPYLDSPVFSAPLLLVASAEVRARAWLEGVAGPVADAAYAITTNAPNVVLVIAEDGCLRPATPATFTPTK